VIAGVAVQPVLGGGGGAGGGGGVIAGVAAPQVPQKRAAAPIAPPHCSQNRPGIPSSVSSVANGTRRRPAGGWVVAHRTAATMLAP
jgi:hypothetical protein